MGDAGQEAGADGDSAGSWFLSWVRVTAVAGRHEPADTTRYFLVNSWLGIDAGDGTVEKSADGMTMAELRCGNFDILADHFSRIPQLCAPHARHTPLRSCCFLIVFYNRHAYADSMLLGACHPIRCYARFSSGILPPRLRTSLPASSQASTSGSRRICARRARGSPAPSGSLCSLCSSSCIPNLGLILTACVRFSPRMSHAWAEVHA